MLQTGVENEMRCEFLRSVPGWIGRKSINRRSLLGSIDRSILVADFRRLKKLEIYSRDFNEKYSL